MKYLNQSLRNLLGFVAVAAVAAVLLMPAMPVAASSTAQEAACNGSGGTWVPATGSCISPDGRTVTGTLQQVINILIFIVGAIAVVMVVIGAIRYTVSQGDQAAVSSAKNTILYAVIGIVLAFAAYGIVNFVTQQFENPAGQPGSEGEV
jgi:hypothetical protein